MSVELGDDATYPMRGVGSISFQMPLGDVLELSDVLFVPSLKKNLLLVSCMIDVQWRVAFEGQQCTINDCSLASPRTLARGVREGGLYRLLVDPMALVHSSERLDEPSSFEEFRSPAWDYNVMGLHGS
jgi:hypothetical protein